MLYCNEMFCFPRAFEVLVCSKADKKGDMRGYLLKKHDCETHKFSAEEASCSRLGLLGFYSGEGGVCETPSLPEGLSAENGGWAEREKGSLPQWCSHW